VATVSKRGPPDRMPMFRPPLPLTAQLPPLSQTSSKPVAGEVYNDPY
jgi:hypothetical protein